MARLACVLVLISAALSVSAPALAQRDPFEPAIDSSADPGAVDDDDVTVDDPEPAPAPERLANTGTESLPWAAVAYALIALGAGVVVVSRVSRASPK